MATTKRTAKALSNTDARYPVLAVRSLAATGIGICGFSIRMRSISVTRVSNRLVSTLCMQANDGMRTTEMATFLIRIDCDTTVRFDSDIDTFAGLTRYEAYGIAVDKYNRDGE